MIIKMLQDYVEYSTFEWKISHIKREYGVFNIMSGRTITSLKPVKKQGSVFVVINTEGEEKHYNADLEETGLSESDIKRQNFLETIQNHHVETNRINEARLASQQVYSCC